MTSELPPVASPEPDPGAWPPGPTGLRPIDRLMLGYMALTGLLLLGAGRGAPDTWAPLGVRVVFILLVLILARWPLPPGRVWRALRLGYPVAYYGFFYGELAILNRLVTAERFDPMVVAWEEALFGGMPAVTLRVAWPARLLSECLHLAYLSYYAMPSLLLVTLVVRRKLLAFEEAAFTITATFMACYAWFILFPVVGPFHHLGPAVLGAEPGVFPALVHRILHQGSSPGTAFPSSHVAIGAATLIEALRHSRFASAVLLILVPLMALGAVYGGFHYAVDALAGLVLAVVMNPLARWGWRRMGGSLDPYPRRVP